jgi:hypothetical protein
VALAALAWVAFWFWAFSFAYSDSFFEYDRCARGSVLAAALFGALAIPSSALLAWRQPSVFHGLAAHAAGFLVAVGPIVLVSLALGRVAGPCHLEADDAMGAGVDLLILVTLGVASLLALALAWMWRAARRRRESARAR